MEILNGQIPLVVYLRGIGGTVSVFAPTGLRFRAVQYMRNSENS